MLSHYNTHDRRKSILEIEFGVTKLPKYDVPDGYTSWEYLQKLCHDGLVRCYGEETKGLKERLDYELGIIQKMGYVDYFLIVWDYIKFARDQHFGDYNGFGWSFFFGCSGKCNIGS